jgi:GDP-mannose 6-dehydrogenase
MRISIFGLGYVGAVTAGCLTKQGHQVIGVDVNPAKAESLNRGEAPIIEPGLPEILKAAHTGGLLEATTDTARAVSNTELSIICVGTPSEPSGALDLSFVRQVLSEIATALRAAPKRHTIVLRSTMLPGSTQSLLESVLPDLRSSLDVYYFPEFLREGTAVEDFLHPSLAVVGTVDGLPPTREMFPVFGEGTTSATYSAAEMIKYACNAFHAAKVTFANEMGRLCKEQGIDGMSVMQMLCRDTRLNISPYYLRPGNPFGGSCLPKDVRALTHRGRMIGASVPLLNSLLPSNEQHLRTLLELIEKGRHREVIILGLSFKSNTDDLRESAMVELAQVLLGTGHAVRIYDPQLNLAQLVGSNKRLIDIKMPHLASLLQPELSLALGSSGVVVVSQKCVPIASLRRSLTPKHHVLDVNGWPELKEISPSYEGFCW